MEKANNGCSFNIMDVTLRDGSYAINFSFTLNQTKLICKNLEDAGVNYIEVGHGIGLNASSFPGQKALHNDDEYLLAAKQACKKSKIGVFCIPGIASLEHLKRAIDCGLDFVRIGTNTDKVKESEKFIKLAKNNNIEAFANYMKSYTLSPQEFAINTKFSRDCGADVVYIVDSAGGMFYGEIKQYYQAIRNASDIKIGFHAHDNLGLAIANNLACVEMGVDFIDCSLQGLGRSSGNASSEILVAALEKKGYHTNIDLLKLVETGHRYVLPLISNCGREALDIISGYADFHSSYMSYIEKYSREYGINPLELIIEYSKEDKVNMDEHLLCKTSQKVKDSCGDRTSNYNFNRYFGHEQN